MTPREMLLPGRRGRTSKDVVEDAARSPRRRRTTILEQNGRDEGKMLYTDGSREVGGDGVGRYRERK